MRIFQVLEGGSNPAVSGSRTWLRNLYEPLLDLGHEVVLFDAARGREAMSSGQSHKKMAFSQSLLDAFRTEHRKAPIDLFFCYIMDGMVDPLVIDEVRSCGVITCNFSCNNTHQFDLVDELSLHFDFNLHSERDAAEKFRAIGANGLWFPMAANPKYYHPFKIPRVWDVTFVGMNYAARSASILHILRNSIEAHAFGPGWDCPSRTRRVRRWMLRNLKLLQAVCATTYEQQYSCSSAAAQLDLTRILWHQFPGNLHAPVSDERMISLYSESKICLGFLDVYDGHDASRLLLQHLHLREFEGPMSGALYLTGFCNELAEFYEPDKEVLVYRNMHELCDKVDYYLKHESEAQRTREAGHRRALECHTYHRRFVDLFNKIGLKPGSFS
jgi:spore maturation protein CgeB